MSRAANTTPSLSPHLQPNLTHVLAAWLCFKGVFFLEILCIVWEDVQDRTQPTFTIFGLKPVKCLKNQEVQ